MSNKIWNKVKLGEIAEIIDSLHQAPTYSVVGYPMVRVTDINGRYLNLNNTFKVSKDVYELFSKSTRQRRVIW
ncbi:MAG: hypothetical protein IPH33_13795 [Bacteroidetes bacterium]|nr:hypothetical protein [Bacteroidota bacterium]